MRTEDGDYKERRHRIHEELERLHIIDPNPFYDLPRWYGKWSSGDLPTWASRRKYISEMYDSLIETLRRDSVPVGSGLFTEATGWTRVDRTVDKIRESLETASTEESFQAIGLLCRECLISLAQAVYDPDIHRTLDGVSPSDTDADRKLEGYIAHELPGHSNEAVRRHAKAALTLADALVHRRTAGFLDAAICSEATISVVNLTAIISGRRNPT